MASWARNKTDLSVPRCEDAKGLGLDLVEGTGYGRVEHGDDREAGSVQRRFVLPESYVEADVEAVVRFRTARRPNERELVLVAIPSGPRRPCGDAGNEVHNLDGFIRPSGHRQEDLVFVLAGDGAEAPEHDPAGRPVSVLARVQCAQAGKHLRWEP